MDVLESVLAKLEEGDYKSAADIIADPANDSTIKLQSMELVSLIANHLTDANAENKPDLYAATETILNRVAQKCSPPEVLYELMEKIRLTKSDEVFTSILKVIQVSVLRLPAKRARCLEWVFQTIIDYLDKIALPDVLNKDMEEREEDLLECEDSIRRLLQLYITLLLFLEPIVKHLGQSSAASSSMFFDSSLTQKNALIGFLLRLMGKLFPFLQLQRTEQPRKTLRHPAKLPAGKSYSIQVAEDMVKSFAMLVKDPLFLLPYGERRSIIQSKAKEIDSEEKSNNDCFLYHETYTTEGFAMLYYLLLSEDLLPENVPQIYDRRYIFEMGLRYVVILLSGERTVVYFKGIRFAQALVRLVKGSQLSARDLEAAIHSTFCEQFVRALERSASVRNREVGITVLTDYIHTFDDEGRYMIVCHLLKTFDHDSVRAYAINVYKDLISNELRHKLQEESLVRWYSGDILKDMLTGHICVLKQGVKTDLLDNSYSIISALSALWVLLKTDQSNRSHIWNYFPTLETQFLLALRTAIDLSRAHYKNEMKAATEDSNEQKSDLEQAAEITISTLNGEAPPVLSKEKKVELCQGMLLRLDMLDFHLARVNGAIEQMRRNNCKEKSEHAMDTE
uniref:Glomulin n=1 Tax=Anopheles maculatus TaxID=74869 RepID=A0A182SRA6_9DIPT